MTDLRTAAQAIIEAVHSKHCLLEFRDCQLIEDLEKALAEHDSCQVILDNSEPSIDAQAVLDEADNPLGLLPEWIAAIEALRQALAAPVEPVAVVFEEFDSQVHYIETIDSKLRLPVGTKLYTTPPSVDALIAEAIEKHDDEMAYAKTVNTRKLAQPYLDALIADIEGIVKCAETATDGDTGDTIYIGKAYPEDDVKAILDKYRGQK